MIILCCSVKLTIHLGAFLNPGDLFPFGISCSLKDLTALQVNILIVGIWSNWIELNQSIEKTQVDVVLWKIHNFSLLTATSPHHILTTISVTSICRKPKFLTCQFLEESFRTQMQSSWRTTNAPGRQWSKALDSACSTQADNTSAPDSASMAEAAAADLYWCLWVHTHPDPTHASFPIRNHHPCYPH